MLLSVEVQVNRKAIYCHAVLVMSGLMYLKMSEMSTSLCTKNDTCTLHALQSHLMIPSHVIKRTCTCTNSIHVHRQTSARFYYYTNTCDCWHMLLLRKPPELSMNKFYKVMHLQDLSCLSELHIYTV